MPCIFSLEPIHWGLAQGWLPWYVCLDHHFATWMLTDLRCLGHKYDLFFRANLHKIKKSSTKPNKDVFFPKSLEVYCRMILHGFASMPSSPPPWRRRRTAAGPPLQRSADTCPANSRRRRHRLRWCPQIAGPSPGSWRGCHPSTRPENMSMEVTS